MPGVDHLADELGRFAKACQQAGEKGLRGALRDGIKNAADGNEAAIRKALKPHLPDRYAEVLDADLRISVSVRMGTEVVVTVIARPVAKQRKLVLINAGNLRHPVYAEGPRRSWTWRDQGEPSVRPGWFDDPNRESQPRVREEIAAALDRLQADIWAETHG